MSGSGEYSPEEWLDIASNLQKQLGPEYLAQRAGPSGTKLTYIEGKTAINIANNIFGFNGWSTDIKDTTVDFVDIGEDKRVSVGVSVTVRITLKDGSYHEDVGYGHDQNARSKGAAFEKARKQAVTDATKRTLRFFGNALGNCLYDNPYLNGIGKMAKPTIQFTPSNLYRHQQFEKKPRAQPQQQQQPQIQAHPPPSIPPQIQYQSNQNNNQPAAAAAAKQIPPKPAPYQQRQFQQQPKPQQSQPQLQEPVKPVQPKVEPSSLPVTATKSTAVASSSSTATNDIDDNEGNNEVIEHTYVSAALMEPIIPEDSFSYEGDDAFYAQIMAIDEVPFGENSGDEMLADLSIPASNSPPKSVGSGSGSAPGSQNGTVRREAPLSDLDKESSNKRTCLRT